MFYWGKWNFEPIGNFGHATKSLTIGKALQKLFRQSLNVNNANIS